MNQKDFMVDLHCHPNIKAFNSGHPKPTKNLWEKIEHEFSDTGFMRIIRDKSTHILKRSQCNLDTCIEGNVRVINLSLYPMEHGFLNLRDVPGLMMGKNSNELTAYIAGLNVAKVNYMKSDTKRYFKDLIQEYEYVRDGEGPSPDGKNAYKIVNNYTELKQVIDNEPNTIAVILSIEGGHAFGCGEEAYEGMPIEEHKALISENIKKVKDWKYPPFTVNLAHHFWNQLTGHATSIKAPVNGLLTQARGKDKGLTELGRHALREMLSRHNGKRIVIDTKHMSIAARFEYYGFVRNYNYLNPDDKIPIITSHSGVNGYKDMTTSLRKKDNMAKSRKSVFHKWSINVSDEEIRIIQESGGLIGVMMDKGLLGGINLINKAAAIEDVAKQREEFCRLIWLNVFQIIDAVGHEGGWDVPAIGTDYDGTITHIDPYETAADMPTLREDLIAYLHKHGNKKDLWYGQTPEQMVARIMNGNAMQFYKKYFI